MAGKVEVVEQPTVLPNLAVLVVKNDEAEAAQPPLYQRLVARLGQARRLRAAAVFAWRAKSHREQRSRHEARDHHWTAQVRERLDEAGVLGFVHRGGPHAVRVRMAAQTPRQVKDPVGLITALGEWIELPGLVKGLSLDWDQLDELCQQEPHLARAIAACVEQAPQSRRVLIDRLP